jgi:S1-C subfamily serine protease
VKLRVAAALMALAGAVALGACGGSDKPKKLTQEEVIKKVTPSTVQVQVKLADGDSYGTGEVIAPNLVLTNSHVVAGATAIKVAQGSESVPARLIAQQPCEDVALVKLVSPLSGLVPIEIGTSKGLEAGQPVTAIGFPVSFSETGVAPADKPVATQGTISQPSTSAVVDKGYPKLPSVIQHQAPIGHGNSGGPLVDKDGKLIGINTLGLSSQETTQNSNYAIAIDHIKTLLPELKAGKSTGDLGWNLAPIDIDVLKQFFDESQTQAVAQALTQVGETNGLMVLGSTEGSAARNAHFVPGDYITSINGRAVTSVQDVCDIVLSASPGASIRVNGRYLGSAAAAGHEVGDKYSQPVTVPK